MMNHGFYNENQTLIYEEYACMEAKDPTPVGKRIVTNAPGCVGHNYAFWSVESVSPSAKDGKKVVIVAQRIGE